MIIETSKGATVHITPFNGEFPVIPTLADSMMFGRGDIAKHKPVKKMPSQKTMDTFERNKNKGCTICGKPRHITRSGRCFTTFCTEHHVLHQADQRTNRGAK